MTSSKLPPVHFITLALDAMPFIAHHYNEFKRLPFDWTWHVVEGVAAPVNCTAWCASIAPRLSRDGTTRYVSDLSRLDSRVRHYKRPMWHGKVAMMNAPLSYVRSDALVMQVDSDELWNASTLETMLCAFVETSHDHAYFACRYYLGPDIIITTPGGYGDYDYEWLRLWKYKEGERFVSHEPPVLGKQLSTWRKQATRKLGFTFDHYAYATRSQVEFKSLYYGSRNNVEHGKDYANAPEQWDALQRNLKWPADASEFLPWIPKGTACERIRP